NFTSLVIVCLAVFNVFWCRWFLRSYAEDYPKTCYKYGLSRKTILIWCVFPLEVLVPLVVAGIARAV
ncbi:MAG: hypothetical protein LBD97_01090, partial [Bifidobacteriaceae bacterium]|nr:hypothetical protein [Bifidobacteriaceae bacterium]